MKVKRVLMEDGSSIYLTPNEEKVGVEIKVEEKVEELKIPQRPSPIGTKEKSLKGNKKAKAEIDEI
jgi:hypothetical protein